MMAFQFDPTDGLLNGNVFPTVPESETAARQQFQTLLNQIRDAINAHLADTVTESLTLIRDLALTGQQTIALATNKMPKRINISASMHGTPRLSIGSWTNGTGQCQFEFDIGKWSGTASAIVRLTDTDPNINRVNGIISSVQNGSFVINWTKDGAGITGNAFLIIDVLYHE